MPNHPAIHRVLLFACLFSCLSYSSGQTVRLQSFDSNPREGFSVLFSAAAEPISGIQFEIEYDSAAGLLFPSPGSATRDSTKTLMVQDLSSSRKRFIVYGFNSGGVVSGSLVDIGVSPRSNSAVAVRLLEAKAVFGNGGAAPVTVGTSNLSVAVDTSLHLTLTGVWNAASGQPAPVSGGTIMTLRGAGIGPPEATLPTGGAVAFTLAGFRVTFDGIPAPLLYADSGQINVVVPWAITNRAATQISVTRNSTLVAGILAPLASPTPEIFTASTVGTGPGAVRNQDGTVNTALTPALRNSIIEIYGTGIGPLNPVGIDGAVAGVSYAIAPVSVTIGGIPAEVVYAGSAPSLVSGVFQINCRIPEGVASGSAVEVRVQTGAGSRSAAGITISVQ